MSRPIRLTRPLRNNGRAVFVILATIVFTRGGAVAAPFCLPVAGGPPLCIYNDAAACYARAAPERESCFLNPAEIQIPPGARPFCSVDSERIVQCIYESFNSGYANIRVGTGFCFPSASDHPMILDPDRPR